MDDKLSFHGADAITVLCQLALLRFDPNPILPTPEEGWVVVL